MIVDNEQQANEQTRNVLHRMTLTPPARNNLGTEIYIGSGALGIAKNVAKGHDRIVILYDTGITSVAEKIIDSIGDCVRIPVKSGDASKSFTEVDRIISVLLEADCSRKTLLFCIGGGMISDLGGFIASVFMRGIPCVLAPTTLLGMVDAAIGGKTAVNAGQKKNMIGTISHPSSVFIDTDLLQTLPASQLAEGLAEVIKIAAIIDRPFFEWLEDIMPDILKRTPEILEECVLRAVTAKVNIIQADEHDREERLLLNFGHTIGHAVEALSMYKISHGNCVSIGIAAEMKLANFSESDRVIKLLGIAGLPLVIPVSMKPENLWRVMQSDKKNEAGAVRIVVPKRLGEGSVQVLTQETFLTLFR